MKSQLGNKLGRWLALLATVVMLGCQGEQAAEEITEQAEEPATLGSMDEQYAWVGDLGDRDALPGKPLYIEHCAGCHEAQVYKAPHTRGWN